MRHLASSLLLVGVLVAASADAFGSTAKLSSNCDTCVTAVQLAEDFSGRPDSAAILTQLAKDHVCSSIRCSKRRAKCVAQSQFLSSVLLTWLRSASTPAALCADQHVCGSALADVSLYTQPMGRVATNRSLCTMCTYVVTSTKKLLNNTAAQDALKQKLLKICGDLPQDLAASCSDFVNTYEPLITNFINTADPGKLCELIGACAAKQLEMARPAPPLPSRLVQVLAALRRATSSNIIAQQAPLAAELDGAAVAGPSNDMCDVCKLAVIEAHSLLVNPIVQGDILNYTKALCETMGPSVSDICKEYVDIYSPVVFDMVTKYLVPETLCPALGLCEAQPTLLQRLYNDLLTLLGLMPPKALPVEASGQLSGASWQRSRPLVARWVDGARDEGESEVKSIQAQ